MFRQFYFKHGNKQINGQMDEEINRQYAENTWFMFQNG